MNLNDLKKMMKGVFIVQTTPFNKDGSLDLEGMRKNTLWLLERTVGKDFVIVPQGSSGEFYAMSDSESKAVITTVVEEVNGKLPVLVGTGRAGTKETIEMCRYAQSVGADGVQVILPYYHIPKEEGMYQHFKQIAESIDIGIMIYNNPSVSGCWIKPHLMTKLSKISNIIAVKENTPNILSHYQMLNTVDPKDMVILCGKVERMFPYEALNGSPGFASYIANFVPGLSYSLYEAAVKQNFAKAMSILDGISPLFNFINKVSMNHGGHTGVTGTAVMYISTIKAAMDMIGLKGGEVRLPLLGLNEMDKRELAEILRKIEILR